MIGHYCNCQRKRKSVDRATYIVIKILVIPLEALPRIAAKHATAKVGYVLAGCLESAKRRKMKMFQNIHMQIRWQIVPCGTTRRGMHFSLQTNTAPM